MKSWIKCVIFDLDGVLFDAAMLHFRAFKAAVQEVSGFDVQEEWYFSYDGITSRQKLEILSAEHGLNRKMHQHIMESKRIKTLFMIREEAKPDQDKIELFQQLRQFYDVKICVASNSRLEFADSVLRGLGIRQLVDSVLGGDSVQFPKPHPQIYLKTICDMGVMPYETIIFEDSNVGLKAALDAGTCCVHVQSVDEVTLPFVLKEIRDAEKEIRGNQLEAMTIHQIHNTNVIVPMAGRGSRFSKEGITVPKPFIDVRGKPMVQVSVDSCAIPGRYIFCAQSEHIVKYDDEMLSLANYLDDIVEVDGITEGAACTVLLAKKLINNDDPLFIINSDQYIEWDYSRFMIETEKLKADGGIMTFESTGTKWSYAKTESETSNIVTEVAEKVPISTHATVGIYYWRRGSDFVKYAERMIALNERVNNEFYVCPVYNGAIEDGKKIIIFPVDRMLGLGTPEDLKENLEKL